MKKIKLKDIFCIFGASLILVGCDGKTESEIIDGATKADSATATVPTSVREGEVVTFFANEGDPLLFQLVFTGNQTAQVDTGLGFFYTPLSTKSFTITLSGEISQAERFSRIVDNLLGSNSSLASEFRELIQNKLTPDAFTPAELDRLITILTISGADIRGDDVDNLTSTSFIEYNCLVTSTQGEANNGILGGVYSVEALAQKVGFRFPTSAELAEYRFLKAISLIPTLTGVDVNLGLIEAGTWTMELRNL